MNKQNPIKLNYDDGRRDDQDDKDIKERVRHAATIDMLVYVLCILTLPIAQSEKVLIGVLVFPTGFEISLRRTVGMMARRLLIRDGDGDLISGVRIIVRTFVKYLYFMVLGADCLFMIFCNHWDKYDYLLHFMNSYTYPLIGLSLMINVVGYVMVTCNGRAVHDLVSGTKVGE
jgi:hypothetical protein